MSSRPRENMMEWEEVEAATTHPGLRYALWKALWHANAKGAWGDMIAETRQPGYDGELT